MTYVMKVMTLTLTLITHLQEDKGKYRNLKTIISYTQKNTGNFKKINSMQYIPISLL